MTGLVGSGYAVVPQFIGVKLARELAAESRVRWDDGEFVRAAIGIGDQRQIAGKVRSDEIRWLEQGTLSIPQTKYWNQMENLRLALNRALFLGLFELEAHFASFPPGGFYKAHLDCHQTSDARILSTIIYLDEFWSDADGGQLRLFTDQASGVDGDSVDIFPEAGKLVIFASPLLWHEVRTANRQRHSLAGWFRGR